MDQPKEIFFIALITIVILARPIEHLFEFIEWSNNLQRSSQREEFIGDIIEYRSPNIVIAHQKFGEYIDVGKRISVFYNKNRPVVGISLGYLGSEDGKLLRILLTKDQSIQFPGEMTPICSQDKNYISINNEDIPIKGHNDTSEWRKVCGIVMDNTNSRFILCEYFGSESVKIGDILTTKIKGYDVYLQVLSASIEKYKPLDTYDYGYAKIRSRCLGQWEAEKKSFISSRWIPERNELVFKLAKGTNTSSCCSIGRLPGTDIGCDIDIHKLVTHSTVIFGITGAGKSYLAFELMCRMLRSNIKVVCFDFSREYINLMEKLGHKFSYANSSQIDQDYVIKFLENPNEGIIFIDPLDQTSNKNNTSEGTGNNSQGTSENLQCVSKITETFLEVKKNPNKEFPNVCLVYEEAHSYIPETGFVIEEGGKKSSNKTASSILQGRKYGMGCLVVTQRTANVSKTILSQCNTVFALKSYDDSSHSFLSNHVGSEYANEIFTLGNQQAILFGHASQNSMPLIIELNDHEAFLNKIKNYRDCCARNCCH